MSLMRRRPPPSRSSAASAEHPHVAAAHRHDEVALADLSIQEVDHVGAVRQVHDGGRGRRHRDAVDHEPAGHAGDRLLSRAVHVGHEHEVGAGDARAELAPERLHPRVPVRLHQRDQPRGPSTPGRLDRDGHLGRRVPVVVEEVRAARPAAPLEPAVHAGERADARPRRRRAGPRAEPRRRSPPPRSTGCGRRRPAAAGSTSTPSASRMRPAAPSGPSSSTETTRSLPSTDAVADRLGTAGVVEHGRTPGSSPHADDAFAAWRRTRRTPPRSPRDRPGRSRRGRPPRS